MYFESLVIEWRVSTLIFYLCILFGCMYISKMHIKIRIGHRKNQIDNIFFIFLILLFVKGFGTTGRDLRTNYYYNFVSATSLSSFRDKSLEIGYQILNVIVRKVSDQYSVFIFIVAFLTLVPVFFVLKKYQDNIDVPHAFLLYTSVFFISSFSPIRTALAASVALFAFDAMVEKKMNKALFWIIFATIFHTSAIIILIPFFFCVSKTNNRKLVIISLAFLFIVVFLGRNSVTSLLASSDRYYIYSSFKEVHIGFEQIIYYLPIIILFYMGRKYDNENEFKKISYVYIFEGLTFGMLGYIVSIFGRFQLVFLPLFIIVSHYTKILKMHHRRYRLLIDLVVILYCISRFFIYITQYYSMEDLMPYTNIFGWKL